MAFSTSTKMWMPSKLSACLVMLACLPAFNMASPLLINQCESTCGPYGVTINMDFLDTVNFTTMNGVVTSQEEHASVITHQSHWNKNIHTEVTEKKYNITSPDKLRNYEITINVKSTPIEPPTTPEDVRIYGTIQWIHSVINVYKYTYLSEISTISDLKDGKHILVLMQKIMSVSGVPKVPETATENFKQIIHILTEHKIHIDVEINQLITGNTDALMILMEKIRDFQITWELKPVTENMVRPENNPVNILQTWCASSAANFGVVINDFTSSWNDGLALGAIMAKWHSFNYQSIVTMSVTQRLEYIFKYANKRFNIPMLLRPQDLASNIYDERTIILYVTYLFQHAPHSPQDLKPVLPAIDLEIENFRIDILKKISVYKQEYHRINSGIKQLFSFRNFDENTITFILSNKQKVERYQSELNAKISEIKAHFENTEVVHSVYELYTRWSIEFNEFYLEFTTELTKVTQIIHQNIDNRIEYIKKSFLNLEQSLEETFTLRETDYESYINQAEAVLFNIKYNDNLVNLFKGVNYELSVAQRLLDVTEIETITAAIAFQKERYNKFLISVTEISVEIQKYNTQEDAEQLRMDIENVKNTIQQLPSNQSVKQFLSVLMEKKEYLRVILSEQMKLKQKGSSKISSVNYRNIVQLIEDVISEINKVNNIFEKYVEYPDKMQNFLVELDQYSTFSEDREVHLDAIGDELDSLIRESNNLANQRLEFRSFMFNAVNNLLNQFLKLRTEASMKFGSLQTHVTQILKGMRLIMDEKAITIQGLDYLKHVLIQDQFDDKNNAQKIDCEKRNGNYVCSLDVLRDIKSSHLLLTVGTLYGEIRRSIDIHRSIHWTRTTVESVPTGVFDMGLGSSRNGGTVTSTRRWYSNSATRTSSSRVSTSRA